MPAKPVYFIAIFILSLINNLLVPFTIYYFKYGFFKKRNKDFIGCNTWGIIMDGILAGLVNITALNMLIDLHADIKTADIMISIILGFLFMLGAHFYMVWAKWKIWIMPRPWKFNLAGYWHLFSMTIQMSFLFYPIILVINNPLLWEKEIVKASFSAILILSILFLLCLILMKKGVKLGFIKISNQPW